MGKGWSCKIKRVGQTCERLSHLTKNTELRRRKCEYFRWLLVTWLLSGFWRPVIPTRRLSRFGIKRWSHRILYVSEIDRIFLKFGTIRKLFYVGKETDIPRKRSDNLRVLRHFKGRSSRKISGHSSGTGRSRILCHLVQHPTPRAESYITNRIVHRTPETLDACSSCYIDELRQNVTGTITHGTIVLTTTTATRTDHNSTPANAYSDNNVSSNNRTVAYRIFGISETELLHRNSWRLRGVFQLYLPSSCWDFRQIRTDRHRDRYSTYRT